MDTFKIALFGHRDFDAHLKVEARLLAELQCAAEKYGFIEVFIGRSGEFDCFAASVVKRLQKMRGTSDTELTLVLPYWQKNIGFYERYYDHVIIPETVEGVYPKAAIVSRNRWMLEQCDLLICYVTRQSGGAYAALRYAKARGKEVRNLASPELCAR